MTPRPKFELRIAGRKVLLGERTIILGVVNVTPDSFSDGGLYLDPPKAIEHGLDLVREGADWLDIGGESTRPGAHPVSAQEELRRILPVLQGLKRQAPSVPLSIDTTKAEVAEAALRAGASIVNDISGLRFDPRLAEVARQFRSPLILMHLRGRPETMQQKPFARSIWPSLREGLAGSVRRALAAGLRRSQLIIDPGLGFGKTRRQNYEILAQLDRLRRLRLPILAGTSRKSFVQAVVAGEGLTPSPRGRHAATPWPVTASVGAGLALPNKWPQPDVPLQIADAAAVVVSIISGAHIVRVHDVAGVLPAVRIADAVLKAAASS